jgi:predicted nucleic acid-binding protein
LWAELESRGAVIGPHDLQIAATTSVLAYSLGTINTQEFQRISGLQVVDGNPFLKC